jgi:hypothetical protein
VPVEVCKGPKCRATQASARLEVECEGGGGDKGSVAAAARTAQIGGLVDFRIQVATEVALALEMTIAIPAVMMPGTLSVVLLKRIGASEVTAAIVARPVDTGTAFVLVQGMVVREPCCAAITIRHGMVVVRCEEVIARGGSSISEFILYYIYTVTRVGHRWPQCVIINQNSPFTIFG